VAEIPNKKDQKRFFEQKHEAAYEAFRHDLLSPADSREIDEKKEKVRDWQSENEELNLENRREKKEIRKRWNFVLLLLVVTGFVLSYLMIICIGLGWLNFNDNVFAVPSVVAAGVIQTFGLAKLAIRYFFSEDGDSKLTK